METTMPKTMNLLLVWSSSSIGVALLLHGGEASAHAVATPIGQVDSACVHEIPRGASVDVQTGDVTINNARIQRFDPCNASIGTNSQASSASSRKVITPGPPVQLSEWYDVVNADAPNINGLSQFNYFTVLFTVPQNPTPPGGDTPVFFFFPGITARQSDGTAFALVQNVLQWGNNDAFGGSFWVYTSWWIDKTGNAFFITPIGVNAGDSLSGHMEQYAGSPDAWDIYSVDWTTPSGNESPDLHVYDIPDSWPKFNEADLGVLEAYANVNGQAVFLQSCQDLPPVPSMGQLFQLSVITQAGPTWADRNDVTGSTAWGYGQIFDGGPSCNWNGNTFQDSNGTTYASLGWSP